MDDLSQILELQETFQRRGLTFYIHIDGAWGGYFASVLWNRRMQRCTTGRQSVKQSGMIIGRNRKPNSWDGQMYSGPPNLSNNPVWTIMIGRNRNLGLGLVRCSGLPVHKIFGCWTIMIGRNRNLMDGIGQMW